MRSFRICRLAAGVAVALTCSVYASGASAEPKAWDQQTAAPVPAQ